MCPLVAGHGELEVLFEPSLEDGCLRMRWMKFEYGIKLINRELIRSSITEPVHEDEPGFDVVVWDGFPEFTKSL